MYQVVRVLLVMITMLRGRPRTVPTSAPLREPGARRVRGTAITIPISHWPAAWRIPWSLVGIIVPTMPDGETDLLRMLEDLVQGSEVWEIARRYRLHRYRHSDAEYQTVEVEMMRNRDLGWRVVARDAARNISVSGNPHPDLNVVMATMRWQDLEGQAVPQQRSSDT